MAALLVATAQARADEVVGQCGERARAWATACAERTSLAVTPAICLGDRMVVEVATGAPGAGDAGVAALRIDVTAKAEGAIARAGGLGLSPVGNFKDWAQEPAWRRDALTAVAGCVERDPSLLARAAQDAAGLRGASAPAGSPASPASPPGGTLPATPGSAATSPGWSPVIGWLIGLLALVIVAALASRRSAALHRAFDRVRARWHAGPLSAMALLAVLIVVEVWAARAADPDFYLPDPFHALVAVVACLYLLAGFVRGPRLRHTLQVLAFALPILVLVMEVRLAARDRSIASLRMAISGDALLRYTYRPGARVQDAGGEMTITDDGLWDARHVIPKPAGVTRVVVLGDSVPNDPSLPFAKRFPHVFETQLARSLPGESAAAQGAGPAAPGGSAAAGPSSRRVEVINVSCEGYNTIQEVRLLEKVGFKYQPDLIVVAYVLNDPFLQNGAYRRFGNSYFAFRLAESIGRIGGRSACSLFAPLHAGYNFDLVVRASFERLRLLVEPRHIPVVVAVLPIVENFDDPVCLAAYDKVTEVARAQGFQAVRVADAFSGLEPAKFLKPDAKSDVTHPNADGHARIAIRLSEVVAPLLWAR